MCSRSFSSNLRNIKKKLSTGINKVESWARSHTNIYIYVHKLMAHGSWIRIVKQYLNTM